MERTIYVDHWFNILRLFVYSTIIIYFILLGGLQWGLITEFTSDFNPEVCKKYFTLTLYCLVSTTGSNLLLFLFQMTLLMYPST